jgi:hypothetical protein
MHMSKAAAAAPRAGTMGVAGHGRGGCGDAFALSLSRREAADRVQWWWTGAWPDANGGGTVVDETTSID